jgi:SWI/SNF-related matrix-associated actin-dependent regulator of chromatin subfamily A3
LIEPPPITDFTQAPIRNNDGDETDDDLRTGTSAKIDQLIHLLRLTPSTDKSLVFSQFTSFLDKAWNTLDFYSIIIGSSYFQIGDALDDVGIGYCRFDGKMSAKRRADTIAKFCIPVKDTPAVLEEPMGKSSRLRPPTQPQPQSIEIDDDGDNASDFAPDDDQSDDGDTDFDSGEDSRAKRRKGKSKAKRKEKAPVKSKILEALGELDEEPNPRVMLISLKGAPFVGVDRQTLRLLAAGALGLNLTVANNVFL